MSKARDAKNEVLGTLAALRTMLRDYPIFSDVNQYGINDENSFELLFSILYILGVSQADIINWISDFLTDKGGNGNFAAMEASAKAILLNNVKKMFSCSINPIIPDYFMDDSAGVMIDAAKIDINGILNYCPISSGRAFYFDAAESDFAYTDESSSGGVNQEYSGYTMTTDDLWMSRDFNAYLWYVLNHTESDGKHRLYWDNRTSKYKDFKNDKDLMLRFFNTDGLSGTTVIDPVPISGTTMEKRYILKCECLDSGTHGIGSKINVSLNSTRYKDKYTVNYLNQTLSLNKTAFEFNFDYIYSLQLFNPKTIVTSVVNAIFGLLTNPLKKEETSNKVRDIVRKIIKTDDYNTEDCYYTFDNSEYEAQLNDAIRKHEGVFYFGTTPITLNKERIDTLLRNIGTARNIKTQQQAIAGAITEIAMSVASDDDNNNGSAEFTLTSRLNLAFCNKLITELINETVTQICLQVMGPKVGLLMELNGRIMGDTEDDDSSKDLSESMDKFMKNFENFIVQTVKQLKSLIVYSLYKYVMDMLYPLLELYISRLMLESVRYHRMLLENLYRYLTLSSSGLGTINGLINGENEKYVIDNVNYADIVPEQTSPTKRC